MAKEKLNLFGEVDDGRLHANLNNTQSIVPRFSMLRIPVGYEKGEEVKVTEDVSYYFKSLVRDNSVKMWLILLKIFTDTHYEEILSFSKKPIELKTFTEQFVGNFSLEEVKMLMYGKKKENKLVLNSISRIMDIDIFIYSKGKKIGITNFIQTAVILEDKKTLRVAFNSIMLYSMAKNMRAMNFNKILELDGSALRLFIAMNNNKKPLKNGGYGYTSKDHVELCKTINVDPIGRNTIGNIREDFKNIGIAMDYNKFANKWEYPKK